MKKQSSIFLLAVMSLFFISYKSFAQKKYDLKTLKPRIVVLTDIAPINVEPDDMESMIRLLTHSDLYEIEALVTTSGWNSSGKKYPLSWNNILNEVINAYEKDLPNLMKRSSQTSFFPLEKEAKKQYIGYWPSPEYLRSITMMGSLSFGTKTLGDNNHSKASDFIIRLIDEKDDRPIWFALWGGGNTLSQAIWQVKQERTPKEVEKFLSKIYIYAITDQDVPWNNRHKYKESSHYWLRKEFGNKIKFIWDESAWLSQNGIGASKWKEYANHIQKHGNLGNMYPKNKYGVEGDTPSFLHILPNGLNDPTQLNQVGWGGYFVWEKSLDKETYCYTNASNKIKLISQKYEKYFYQAAFNNFAARMDWAKEGKGNRNPIVVVNKKQGIGTIHLKVKPGKTIVLDATGTFDPDNNDLSYKWWYLPEAGNYQGHIVINNHSDIKASLVLPSDAKGKRINIICEVTDNGIHPLTSYRRIVVEVK